MDWNCPACTFENSSCCRACLMCNTSRKEEHMENKDSANIDETKRDNHIFIPQSVVSTESLQPHINAPATHHCPICYSIFDSPQKLGIHIRDIHGMISPSVQLSSVPAEPIDLSLFRQFHSCNNGEHENCGAVKRLIACLTYYTSLDIDNNITDRKQFTLFIDGKYGPQIIDDFHHFSKNHEHQTQDILKHQHENIDEDKYILETKCEINSCHFVSTHYRIQKGNGKNSDNYTSDSILNTYIDILNSLHLYLFHLYELSLRNDIINANETKEINKNQDINFDHNLAQIMSTSRKGRRALRGFNNKQLNVGTKYNITTDQQYLTYGGLSDKIIDSDETYLDYVVQQLSIDAFDDELISKFKHFINNEEYDTESVDIDLRLNNDEAWYLQFGNISMEMQNTQFADDLLAVFTQSKAFCAGFSVGIPWTYNDKNSEHYVAAKYENLKEEVLNYDHISMEQHEEEILPKVNFYIKSEIVKRFQWRNQQFGIANLICLVLYCDYTDQSYQFTKSFRKSSPFQTLSELKKQHSKYYWWGRTLKNTVNIDGDYFGDIPMEHRKFYRDRHNLIGPFFSGMSVLMPLPQFMIYLNSPTSTSVHIEIATRFSGDQGMILQFDNTKGDAIWIRGFDCSWISRFKEEDERLFYASPHPLNISSVRIIDGCINLTQNIQSITDLDNALTNAAGGKSEFRYNISEKSKSGSTLSKLFHDILNNSTQNGFNPYIYNTFRLFIQSKTKITIDIWGIDQFIKDQQLKHLIFYKCQRVTDKRKEVLLRDDDDETNVLHKQLLKIFKQIQYIEINTSIHYPFSLMRLLITIQDTAIRKVTISAKGGWCFRVWSWSRSKLQSEYKKANFDIRYEMKGSHIVISSIK